MDIRVATAAPTPVAEAEAAPLEDPGTAAARALTPALCDRCNGASMFVTLIACRLRMDATACIRMTTDERLTRASWADGSGEMGGGPQWCGVSRVW